MSTNPNEMYATKLLKQQNRSVVANRLTTDAEPNVFTEQRKKQCAERRNFGKRKEKVHTKTKHKATHADAPVAEAVAAEGPKVGFQSAIYGVKKTK